MKKRIARVVVGCVLVLSMVGVLTGCDSLFNKETYTPASKAASVAKPVIGVEGTLRVGINATNPPMAGQASKIVGIDVDIAAAIADEWGLKLEIVDAGTNPLTSLQNGTIDFALGYDTASTNSALTKTSPYLQKGIALFSLDENAGIPTEGSVIVAQSTSMSAWTIGSQFETSTLSSVSDLKSAFAALTDGSAQYVAADAIIGMYAAKTAGVKAYIVAMAQPPTGYCAVTLSTNTDLNVKLSAELKQLKDQGVIDVIETKWMDATVDLSATPLTPDAKTAAEKEAAEKAQAGEEGTA